MKTLAMGIFAFCLATGAPAVAEADPHMECETESGSQVEVGNCLVEVEKAADAALKIVFGFAMDAAKELDDLTAPRRDVVPALEASQAAWQDYRDKHCEHIETTYGGGSGSGIALQNCRIELSRARFKELFALLPNPN